MGRLLITILCFSLLTVNVSAQSDSVITYTQSICKRQLLHCRQRLIDGSDDLIRSSVTRLSTRIPSHNDRQNSRDSPNHAHQ